MTASHDTPFADPRRRNSRVDERMPTAFIGAATRLNDSGVEPLRAIAKRAPLAMPDDFGTALGAHPEASARFTAFSATGRCDDVEWIVEVRQRHWKYRS